MPLPRHVAERGVGRAAAVRDLDVRALPIRARSPRRERRIGLLVEAVAHADGGRVRRGRDDVDHEVVRELRRAGVDLLVVVTGLELGPVRVGVVPQAQDLRAVHRRGATRRHVRAEHRQRCRRVRLHAPPRDVRPILQVVVAPVRDAHLGGGEAPGGRCAGSGGVERERLVDVAEHAEVEELHARLVHPAEHQPVTGRGQRQPFLPGHQLPAARVRGGDARAERGVVGGGLEVLVVQLQVVAQLVGQRLVEQAAGLRLGGPVVGHVDRAEGPEDRHREQVRGPADQVRPRAEVGPRPHEPGLGRPGGGHRPDDDHQRVHDAKVEEGRGVHVAAVALHDLRHDGGRERLDRTPLHPVRDAVAVVVLVRAGEVGAPRAGEGDRPDDVHEVDAEEPVRGLVEIRRHRPRLPRHRDAVDELVAEAVDDAGQRRAAGIGGVSGVHEHDGHPPAAEGRDDPAVLRTGEVTAAPGAAGRAGLDGAEHGQRRAGDRVEPGVGHLEADPGDLRARRPVDGGELVGTTQPACGQHDVRLRGVEADVARVRHHRRRLGRLDDELELLERQRRVVHDHRHPRPARHEQRLGRDVQLDRRGRGGGLGEQQLVARPDDERVTAERSGRPEVRQPVDQHARRGGRVVQVDLDHATARRVGHDQATLRGVGEGQVDRSPEARGDRRGPGRGVEQLQAAVTEGLRHVRVAAGGVDDEAAAAPEEPAQDRRAERLQDDLEQSAGRAALGDEHASARVVDGDGGRVREPPGELHGRCAVERRPPEAERTARDEGGGARLVEVEAARPARDLREDVGLPGPEVDADESAVAVEHDDLRRAGTGTDRDPTGRGGDDAQVRHGAPSFVVARATISGTSAPRYG
ncbi:MAG: hypothetical protein AVDCRST_MAG79-1070 [uncultured Thermoleophilia bacterium]|uniref:Uncharacterized protein n=1 Tax=uncultured Thermoleophilia bacterium TaxID=1497501 RepID=A0A6J4TVC9_9ACTN|nr:MAG: hypothetical protein AVDCRST_MAG79-1070 [uncultured Thermoleophilia bacterium]